jgi:hypothetical protein
MVLTWEPNGLQVPILSDRPQTGSLAFLELISIEEVRGRPGARLFRHA